MSQAVVLRSPFPLVNTGFSIFLAGSIEMGTAVNWQEEISSDLADQAITILNPRRDDWDSSWQQLIDNPMFFQQVTWELEALEYADLIALYLVPGTKSPISLLELGLYARSGKLIVCCPDGFWRKGNVDIVCKRYHVPITANWPRFKELILESIQRRASCYERNRLREEGGPPAS